MMRTAKGTFLLFILLVLSCPGPGPEPEPVPIDFPPGEIEAEDFCIDFEQSTRPEAVNGANAVLLYSDLGIIFSSNPVIFDNPALSAGAQSLFQGNPSAARPARTCGPLEFILHPDLRTREVQFDARNLGFISIPVLVTATAFGEADGTEVIVDQRSFVSQSSFGDLRPVEFIKLISSADEPYITKVTLEYGTCPPHVVIDNLCVSTEERAGTFGSSDTGADRLVYYFDNEQMHTYLQLANVMDSPVEVHVQIWIANSEIIGCEEYDFFDTLTPLDVHTYDTQNVILNSTSAPVFATNPLDGKYGFVVISRSGGAPESLIGSMKIVGDTGYVYSTNAVEPARLTLGADLSGYVNFNNSDGSAFSDLIGITFSDTSDSDTVVAHGVSVRFGGAADSIFITDENENLISCSPLVFSCDDDDTINYDIDLSLPDSYSRGNDRVCNTSIISPSNSSGTLKLPYNRSTCTELLVGDEDGNCMYNTYFAGFIGLNNGTDKGSFDSWWGGEKTDDEE